ncbi:MAG: DPP IV N-terminal domain-containing protein [Bacteroidales bacterium]|nr:DPP IV N-terminal domain-containing protein [Bacteroidales bacterium]
MHKLLLTTLLLTSMTGIASAQTILGIIPQSEGELPTMAQLTPGHPDYIYAPSLLNTYFDEQGEFHYTLPEDAATAQPLNKSEKGEPSADRLWRALNEGDRLWVEQITDGDTPLRYQVSDPDAASDSPDEGQSDIVWGQSVHRNEFGIDGGIFWSPKGHLLAFYRMDQSMVGRYPLLQTDPQEAEVKWIRYPMAGMTSHQVTLGIYNPDSWQTVFLKTNDKPEAQPLCTGTNASRTASGINAPDHYLTNIAWRPDGRQILIAEVNRLQNYVEMNVYDVQTGEFVRTLFTETSDKYVEPKHPAYFLPGSNDRFVWLSERDGYMQAYLYNMAADKVTCLQLTKGSFDISSIVGADPASKFLYFMAAADSPLESNLYSVAIPKKSITHNPSSITHNLSPITQVKGRHSIKVNDQYSQVYDTYVNHQTPRVCQLITLRNGRPVKTEVLYTAADPYLQNEKHPTLARPEVELGTLKAADGVTDLYYRLVKPRDYAKNPARRYPTIVYLYNGPHAQLVTDGYQWGLPGWDCYMANRGYVVFTIDGRGSDNRGIAFEQAIWHNLGQVEALDQLQGVEYLKTLPYVDPDRIGIYGWSYGGFMTTYMMLNYPDTFKVGVCGGPVLDWSRYEVMYGERYMGTPDNNPEGYIATTLIDQTEKLRGHLLIIHDDQDGTVVPQMSMQFLKNAVANGTYPDYLMYIGHEHNVRGKDRVHLLNNISRYFDEHL